MNSPSHSVQGEVLEDSPKRAGHAKSWVIIELLAGIMVESYVVSMSLSSTLMQPTFHKQERRHLDSLDLFQKHSPGVGEIKWH